MNEVPTMALERAVEAIFFVSISPSTEKSDQMRPLPKISKASSEYPYQQVS
jgi:hypothetical protein